MTLKLNDLEIEILGDVTVSVEGNKLTVRQAVPYVAPWSYTPYVSVEMPASRSWTTVSTPWPGPGSWPSSGSSMRA
jgi:hypothetical protein